MISFFLLGTIIFVAGIVWAGVAFDLSSTGFKSITIFFSCLAITLVFWTTAAIFDCPKEVLAWLSHDEVRTVILPAADLEKFGIDLKKCKPLYVKTYWRCSIHQDSMNCNSCCKKDMKYYTLVFADDDCYKLDTYDKLVSETSN